MITECVLYLYCPFFVQEALKNIEGVDPQNALQIYKMSEQKDKK